jgi:N-acetyl-anhydromuramyl-L-alanine amidase AmpD
MMETDNWRFIKARWFTPTQGRTVRVVVIHAMEWTETDTTAEDCAHDFAARPSTNKASAHVCVDSNSIIQCVKDRDIAYAAPGCNNDGIQVELAGFIRQTRKEWFDNYGIKLLDLGAEAVAQYLVKFSLPPIHLSDSELRSGKRGVVGHDQVSRVYKKSTHNDPGPNFPWTEFMDLVAAKYAFRRAAFAARS